MMSPATIGSLSFRPITVADEDFLHRVYASTRQEELAPLDWSRAQKDEFLAMQFKAQHIYYQEQFPDANYQVILLNGEAIGRLYIHHRIDEVRIIDIALIAAHRNQGIGSKLMVEILDDARQAGLPVRIHVEQFNPALRLYRRLGFKQISDTGMYFLMEWRPI